MLERNTLQQLTDWFFKRSYAASQAKVGETPAALKPGAAPKGKVAAAVVAMIAATLAVEGGYVNDKADPGGETNLGITKKVAVQHGYLGPMRTLPHEVAEGIYFQDYIVKPGFLPLVEVDAPVTSEIYDTGVNMGPRLPSLWLQASLNDICHSGLKVDGQIGPGTVEAYKVCQAKRGSSRLCVIMLDELDAKQKARYLDIVAHRPASKKFLKGWLAHRINNVDRRNCSVAA